MMLRKMESPVHYSRQSKRPRLGSWWHSELENVSSIDSELTFAGDGSESKKSDAVDILSNLPEALIAQCFFGGYLDSIEVIRNVSCVCKSLRKMAGSYVKMLDLRAIHMNQHDVGSVVKCFSNLKVRLLSDTLQMYPLTSMNRSLISVTASSLGTKVSFD